MNRFVNIIILYLIFVFSITSAGKPDYTMDLFELFDETLDINSTENYDLLVELDPCEVSFAVIDSIRNKYILLRVYSAPDGKKFTPQAVTDLLGSDDFLGKRFRKTSLLVATGKSTLIPAALYDPALKDEYLKFNHILTPGLKVYSSRIKNPDSFIVFGADQGLSDAAEKFFRGVIPVPQSKTLTEAASHSAHHEHGFYPLLWVGSDLITLLLLENGVLKFMNSYNCRNASDILYYTCGMYSSFSISRDVRLNICGRCELYDDLWSALSEYFPGLRFEKPSGTAGFSYVFNELPQHKYINLFSLSACE